MDESYSPPSSDIGQPEKPKQSRYWTRDEHERFLEALKMFGPRDARRISEYVGTRNAVQTRTHAQKYFLKLERERSKREKQYVANTKLRGSSDDEDDDDATQAMFELGRAQPQQLATHGHAATVVSFPAVISPTVSSINNVSSHITSGLSSPATSNSSVSSLVAPVHLPFETASNIAQHRSTFMSSSTQPITMTSTPFAVTTPAATIVKTESFAPHPPMPSINVHPAAIRINQQQEQQQQHYQPSLTQTTPTSKSFSNNHDLVSFVFPSLHLLLSTDAQWPIPNLTIPSIETSRYSGESLKRVELS